jgi:uncharacterized membrane protein
MRTGLEKIELLLLIYGALIFYTVFILSYLSVSRFDLYMTAFAIEFFLCVIATAPYTSAETRRQMIVGIALLAVFAGVAAVQILAILR